MRVLVSPDFGITYAVPQSLPRLVRLEIIVSLSQRTVHLVDRRTGFSEVYPAGVGRKRPLGGGLTPLGRFATGPDGDDVMWYVPRRLIPASGPTASEQCGSGPCRF